MENSSLPQPNNPLLRFLVSMYSSKKKNGADKNINQAIGRSPLDIPDKSVFKSFLAALGLVLIIGNLFFWIIYGLIWTDLWLVEKNQIGLKAKETFISTAVVKLLVPQMQSKIKNIDPVIMEKLQASFPEKKITVQALATFMGKDHKKLRKQIIGRLTYSYETLFIFPGFAAKAPDLIADEYGFFQNYASVGDETIDSSTWKRYIVISSIQFIRDKLDNGVQHPRRLLFALAGIIQWLTFLAAVWCLILLLSFRVPWAKLQMDLIVSKRLPWHSNLPNADVWDIQKSYFNDLDDKRNYQGMFIVVRLIKDILNVTRSDKSVSVNQIIRERVESYRNSVEIGEYEIINFLIWATPTFGFLGTIFGIISAMENAAAIFAAPTAIEQGIALDKVSSALGVAFDTSFIALVWLIPMTYFLARTRKMEANLFEELEFQGIAHLPPQIADMVKRREPVDPLGTHLPPQING